MRSNRRQQDTTDTLRIQRPDSAHMHLIFDKDMTCTKEKGGAKRIDYFNFFLLENITDLISKE